MNIKLYKNTTTVLSDCWGKHRVNFFLTLAAIMALTACSQDDDAKLNPPIEQAGKNVRLEIKIPGTKTPTTYGMTTANENRINELVVLAYKIANGSEFLEEKIIIDENGIDDDGTGLLNVEVAIAEGEYNRLMLVANANKQVASLSVGGNLSDLQKIEYLHVSGKWNVSTPDYIPMSGEFVAGTSNGIKIQQGTSQTFGNLQMVRMLARVDIRNQSNAVFVLKEVALYNANCNGLIVHKAASYSNTPPAPSLPATLQTVTSPILYDYAALQSDNAMNNEIYLFEAAKATTTTQSSSLRILLKGTYNATDYYYPVDFTYSATSGTITQGDFMPVIRNHQYIFNIVNVSGAGFLSASEALAYTGSFVNIKVKVLTVDDDLSDIYYNSENFLAVSTTGVVKQLGLAAYDSATEDNTITVLTDAASFTVECYDNATGALAGSTVMRSDKTTYSGGSKVDVFLVADYLTTSVSGEFDGYVIVKINGLQSDKIPVYKHFCGMNGNAFIQTVGSKKYKTHRYPTGTNGADECWMVENSTEGSFSGRGYGIGVNGGESGTGAGEYLGLNNGFYYNRVSAINVDNACPEGWILPKKSQWDLLQTVVNADLSRSGRWWGGSLGNANNAFAGLAGNSGGIWSFWGVTGYWWSLDNSYKYRWGSSTGLSSEAESSNLYLYSVRCVNK